MLLSVLVLLLIQSSFGQNMRPIIAVVAAPNNDTNPTHVWLTADYVNWLSQSGARVVPLRYDDSHDKIRQTFSMVNGILFTGGGLTLAKGTRYHQTAQFIFDLAIAANDKGDHFPLWGTCMGFQLLSILAAQDNSVLLEYAYDSENLPLALHLTPAAHSSRLFGPSMPAAVKEALTTQAMTQNLHHDGLLPETYVKNHKLSQIFEVLSTNVDRKGKPFASTIEGKKYPFFGTQWHPERTQFDWGIKEALNRSPEAIRAIQYVSSFFVNEAKKNHHKYPTIADEQRASIYRWNPTFTGDDSSDSFPELQTYYFPVQN